MQTITNFIKKYPYRTGGLTLIVLLLIILIVNNKGGADSQDLSTTIREVELTSVSEYSSGSIGVAVPTATGNSFVIRAESSGRVNRVIEPQTKVTQGDVVAELDNAAQLAALTQAEGVYEAALAAGAKSDISVTDAKSAVQAAKQSALDTNRTALATWNNTLFNTIDQVFSNPRTSTPGVKITTDGQANILNDERVAMRGVLSDWQDEVNSLSVQNTNSDNIANALENSVSRIDRLLNMIDILIPLLAKQDADGVWSESSLVSLRSQFATARSSLNTERSSLQSDKIALDRAEDSLNSAQIGGTSSELSSANANIKQALGGYQAAQNAYDKTFVKAPFSGTVVSLNVSVGNIINAGTDVAIILPDNGVVTERSFILPLSAVKYTPENAYVFTLNDSSEIHAIEVETGLVTTNNITVTGLNGDENIITDVRGLKAGQLVKVK